jgi:hypothetical protein
VFEGEGGYRGVGNYDREPDQLRLTKSVRQI